MQNYFNSFRNPAVSAVLTIAVLLLSVYGKNSLGAVQQPVEPQSPSNVIVEVERSVKRIVREQFGIDDSVKIRLCDHFEGDLKADELDRVELAMALEEEYQFEIPDADWERIIRVEDAVIYVLKHAKEIESYTLVGCKELNNLGSIAIYAAFAVMFLKFLDWLLPSSTKTTINSFIESSWDWTDDIKKVPLLARLHDSKLQRIIKWAIVFLCFLLWLLFLLPSSTVFVSEYGDKSSSYYWSVGGSIVGAVVVAWLTIQLFTWAAHSASYRILFLKMLVAFAVSPLLFAVTYAPSYLAPSDLLPTIIVAPIALWIAAIMISTTIGLFPGLLRFPQKSAEKQKRSRKGVQKRGQIPFSAH